MALDPFPKPLPLAKLKAEREQFQYRNIREIKGIAPENMRSFLEGNKMTYRVISVASSALGAWHSYSSSLHASLVCAVRAFVARQQEAYWDVVRLVPVRSHGRRR